MGIAVPVTCRPRVRPRSILALRGFIVPSTVWQNFSQCLDFSVVGPIALNNFTSGLRAACSFIEKLDLYTVYRQLKKYFSYRGVGM